MRFEFSPFLSALEFFVCKIGRNSKSFLLKHCYRIIFSVRVIPENSIFDTPHHYNMQKKLFWVLPMWKLWFDILIDFAKWKSRIFLFHFPYKENYWIALLSLQIKKSNNEMITRLHILNFWLLKKVSHAYFPPLEISFWKRKIPNDLVYELGCFVMHSSF